MINYFKLLINYELPENQEYYILDVSEDVPLYAAKILWNGYNYREYIKQIKKFKKEDVQFHAGVALSNPIDPVKKGSVVKCDDLVGVAFSYNRDCYFILDGNNNVIEVLKRKSKKIKDEKYLGDSISVLLGIEDERAEHLDRGKDTSKRAKDWEIDYDYLPKLLKLNRVLSEYSRDKNDILNIDVNDNGQLIVDIGGHEVLV